MVSSRDDVLVLQQEATRLRMKRKKAPRTREEKLREAERMAGHWLYLGNRAAERGDKELAERHYDRAQQWHDRMNELLGNGE